MRTTGLEALAFSSVWVAGVAAALCAASAGAMGVGSPGLPVALAAAGTLAIYNLDRLRDLERDRLASPRRSAFVAAHRRGLALLAGGAAGLSIVVAAALGARGIALLAPAFVAGLFHRRLKSFAGWKPLYVAVAWTAVVVGLPALAAARARPLGWVAGIVFTALLSNAIASNLRDGEAAASRLGAAVPLRLARGLALVGVVLALWAPSPVRPLALVPGALLLALGPFQAEERYGLLVVDGALGVGALAALALS